MSSFTFESNKSDTFGERLLLLERKGTLAKNVTISQIIFSATNMIAAGGLTYSHLKPTTTFSSKIIIC